MWQRAMNVTGGGGTSDRLYTFSWNTQNYVCVVTESSSADIVAVFNYDKTNYTPYEDDYIKITMSGTNQLKAEAKKACTLTTFAQKVRTDTAKNVGDILINNTFSMGCAFVKFTN